MIISEITHDKSLAACSLVSHTWNALARPQQFNTLCFDLDSERCKWTYTLYWPRVASLLPRLAYRSFATNTTTEHMGKKMTIRQAWYLFLDFLHDSPHICELVKALVLLYAGNATQRVADDEVFLFIHDIKDVVHYLPELRSLDIVSSDMWSLPGIPPLLPLPPPIQHELQAVHIGKHWDSNIDHIGASRLFCSMVPFVHSRSIALTGYIVCHPFRLPDASSFQPWSALETLSLRDNLNVDTFLAALRSMTSFFLALRRLDIGYIAPRGQQETWDLLHAFSGQLTHVGLQHRYLRSDLYHEPFTTCESFLRLCPVRFLIRYTSVSRLGLEATAASARHDSALHHTLGPVAKTERARAAGVGARAVDAPGSVVPAAL